LLHRAPNMKKIVYTLVAVCLLTTTAFAQNFIMKNKSQVLKQLNKYDTGSPDAKKTISSTDSTITLNISGTGTQPGTFVYHFNKEGKCFIETFQANCDSCRAKYLKGILDRKQYQWRKINENQYVSAFQHKMLLELAADEKDYSLIILYTEWTKELYKLLNTEE
jgi:uncharacterized protein YxeA